MTTDSHQAGSGPQWQRVGLYVGSVPSGCTVEPQLMYLGKTWGQKKDGESVNTVVGPEPIAGIVRGSGECVPGKKREALGLGGMAQG